MERARLFQSTSPAIISASHLPLIFFFFFNISEQQLCSFSFLCASQFSSFFEIYSINGKYGGGGGIFNFEESISKKCFRSKRYSRAKEKSFILLLDVRLREIIIDRGPVDSGAEFPNNAAFVFPRRRGPRINSNFHLFSSLFRPYRLSCPPFSTFAFETKRNSNDLSRDRGNNTRISIYI